MCNSTLSNDNVKKTNHIASNKHLFVKLLCFLELELCHVLRHMFMLWHVYPQMFKQGTPKPLSLSSNILLS